MFKRHLRFGVALAAMSACGFVASIATAANFYRGKKITISIGCGVGGGFDTYSRTVGQFLGRHIPDNPTVLPNNRTGAGRRVNANWLYTVAPQDGTVLGNTGPWLAMETHVADQGCQALHHAAAYRKTRPHHAGPIKCWPPGDQGLPTAGPRVDFDGGRPFFQPHSSS